MNTFNPPVVRVVEPLVEDSPVPIEKLRIVRHPCEQLPDEEKTRRIRALLTYTYYWNESARRIYRKSSVAPWLEKYLRYDDAEYLDILRYNGLL